LNGFVELEGRTSSEELIRKCWARLEGREDPEQAYQGFFVIDGKVRIKPEALLKVSPFYSPPLASFLHS